MADFGVVDLTAPVPPTPPVTTTSLKPGTVNLDRLKGELDEIRQTLQPVLTEADAQAATHFGLRELEIKLAVGLEGSLFFVAKGSADASITLTFGRG
jgi:hypothetical protein